MFFIFFPKKNTDHVVRTYPDLTNVKPLLQAFSHNDYEQKNPLFDALSKGFTFIEADVHLMNNNLYVSHNRPFLLKETQSLTHLYLEPLFEMFQLNGGQIFAQYNRPIHLVIDFKSNANKSYEKLQEILIPFQAMLTRWENGYEIPGAITIMISGNRPVRKLVEKKDRWMCLDGRLEDIGKNYDPSLMPVISDKYSKVFGWNIFSKPPTQEKLLRLHSVANNVHAEGKKLRLWNSPENELVWNALLEAGADIINTDSISQLSIYFSEKESSAPMASGAK